MSSSITPNNINGNFPVYGQNNPSQGFRDNFTNIKTNFTVVKSEIEDLQNKAILKSALTGTVLDNDLNGSILTNPQLRAWTQTFIDLGSLAGPVDVDFNVSNFQKITTQGTVDLSIINWPASQGVGVTGYAVMRIWFVVADITHTIQLPPEVSIGTDDLANFDPVTNSLRFDVPGNFVFDISSADGGDNYLIFDNTRNRVRFRDPSFYFNPDVSPTLLIGFQDVLPLAIQLSRTSDTIQVRGSMTSYGGVLEHGNTPGIGVYNVIDAQQDPPVLDPEIVGNANVGGYSVATTRAFVDPETGEFTTDPRALVSSNDYIGYFNFLGLSLDPTKFPTAFEGAFTEFASIRSFVNGYVGGGQSGNLVPGGNLVLMTKKDGITNPGTGYLHTALSLENDQSVHTYGAQVTRGAEVSAGYQYQDLDSDNEVAVSVNTPVVLLESGTAATIASVDIMMPAAAYTRDGQRMTISSACDITSVNFLNSTSVTYFNDGYLNGASILVVSDNKYLQPGMAAFGIPEYISGQVILSVNHDSPAPGFATLVMSANADASGTPGVTSLTFFTGTDYNSEPASFTVSEAHRWIFRQANATWYKI